MSETASRRRCVSHLHGHRTRADAVEDLARELFGHHAARRGVEHQRRRMRGREPVVQPVHPEIRDRRHVDQHFRHHHEQKRQAEQLSGQSETAASASADVFGYAGFDFRSVHQPQAISFIRSSEAPKQPMMERNSGLVKLRAKKSIAARFPTSARIGYGRTTPAMDRIFIPLRRPQAPMVAIISPASAPTMVAPRILPRGVVTILIWPCVSRSVCARSFS